MSENKKQLETSSMAKASIYLGIGSFVISWIPFVGTLSIPLSGLGLIMAMVGVLVIALGKAKGMGFAIAGLAICGISLAIAWTMTKAITTGFDAVNEAKYGTNQEVVGEGDKVETKDEFASAKNAIKQGDIQLEIVSAKVEFPRFKSFASTKYRKDDEKKLLIKVKITNLSNNKKLGYNTWSDGYNFNRKARLTDNFGNAYALMVSSGMLDYEGYTKEDNIYPKKSITELVMFEVPVDTIEHLNLELPATNVSGSGYFRIRIPKDMVKF